MPHTLTWHGHANFQIASKGVNILIDPFFEGNPSCSLGCGDIEAPDLVLVTHDHRDHVGSAVEICKKTGAHLGAVVGTAAKLVSLGVPKEQVLNGIGFNIGGSLVFRSVTVTMTQAFHSSESSVAVGYILTLPDGYTIYHAGDTGIFSSMELWGQLYDIDLAMLPVGGVFTMDARQGALACKLLRCRAVAPMHWGTFPVLEKTTDAFKRHVQALGLDVRVVDMAPGESVILEKGADTCGCD